MALPMASFSFCRGSSTSGGSSWQMFEEEGGEKREEKKKKKKPRDAAAAHRVGEEQLLDALEERVSAAGQEGRQVRVHLGAQLHALLPALHLDAGERERERGSRSQPDLSASEHSSTVSPWSFCLSVYNESEDKYAD